MPKYGMDALHVSALKGISCRDKKAMSRVLERLGKGSNIELRECGRIKAGIGEWLETAKSADVKSTLHSILALI